MATLLWNTVHKPFMKNVELIQLIPSKYTNKVQIKMADYEYEQEVVQ